MELQALASFNSQQWTVRAESPRSYDFESLIRLQPAGRLDCGVINKPWETPRSTRIVDSRALMATSRQLHAEPVGVALSCWRQQCWPGGIISIYIWFAALIELNLSVVVRRNGTCRKSRNGHLVCDLQRLCSLKFCHSWRLAFRILYIYSTIKFITNL